MIHDDTCPGVWTLKKARFWGVWPCTPSGKGFFLPHPNNEDRLKSGNRPE